MFTTSSADSMLEKRQCRDSDGHGVVVRVGLQNEAGHAFGITLNHHFLTVVGVGIVDEDFGKHHVDIRCCTVELDMSIVGSILYQCAKVNELDLNSWTPIEIRVGVLPV